MTDALVSSLRDLGRVLDEMGIARPVLVFGDPNAYGAIVGYGTDTHIAGFALRGKDDPLADLRAMRVRLDQLAAHVTGEQARHDLMPTWACGHKHPTRGEAASCMTEQTKAGIAALRVNGAPEDRPALTINMLREKAHAEGAPENAEAGAFG